MGEVRVYGAPSEMAGKWIREADHDAALRRAKAEVLEEMKFELNSSRARSYIADTPWVDGHDEAIDNMVKWIDARAAQIEAGHE